jgi:hypothetical protein
MYVPNPSNNIAREILFSLFFSKRKKERPAAFAECQKDSTNYFGFAFWTKKKE